MPDEHNIIDYQVYRNYGRNSDLRWISKIKDLKKDVPITSLHLYDESVLCIIGLFETADIIKYRQRFFKGKVNG